MEAMTRPTARRVAYAHAAYDLSEPTERWLSRVLEAAAPTLDHGLGASSGTATT